MSSEIAVLDPAGFQRALDCLAGLEAPVASAATPAAGAMSAAAAAPLEPGVSASPALAALSDATRTLAAEGREAASALAATVAGLTAWRDGTAAIQTDGATGVEAQGA